ncbi:PPE family protein [Mycobacterium intracellulare]|nr:PPE family protein [Mycobacterium intracellulare]MCA2347129.1 PPE family protein [Mycobacterium intracellulare]
MGAGPMAHVPQITAYTAAAATHFEQGMQQSTTALATAPVFQGSGGMGMLDSATPMAAWQQTAGLHAEAAANTIQSGLTAYSAAVSATIPHEVVVANRVREAALESTNFMGINTPAIAEANAEYGEYWLQNAGAMVGYLGAMAPVVSALTVPLPSLPEMSNPLGATAGLAGLVGEGVSAGVQGLGAGITTGGGVVSAGSGIGTGVATGVSSGVFNGTGAGVQAAGSPSGEQPAAPQPATSGTTAGQAVPATTGTGQGITSNAPQGKAPPLEPGQGAQPPMEESGQSLLGQLTQAPTEMMSSLSSPLESLGQLPQSAAGQLSGLMGPLSALTGGMAGGLGGPPGGGAPGLSAASAPWSGLSGANGGFAGGGSAVTAALTKPSAGGLSGPVGVPGGWWANVGDGAEGGEQPAAGLRSGAAAGRGAMAPGMYGPMATSARSGRGSEFAAVGEQDKTITLRASAHEAPVLTSEGVVHVGQGG